MRQGAVGSWVGFSILGTLPSPGGVLLVPAPAAAA